MNRRRFLESASVLGLGTLGLGRSFLRPAVGRPAPAAPRRVFIDADTANEIDDLYAITRLLLDPGFDVVALSSAQWNHRLSPPDTVLRSQALNEDLLRLVGRNDIPAPSGSEMIMGMPWGGDEPRDSPAAQLMIREARATPPGEKLVIVSLGAVTNLASAVKLAPDILPRISAYILAGRFFADRGVWDKDEFNVRNDLNAHNFCMNTEGLELHVMPVNILLDFTFQLDDVIKRLAGTGALWDYLVSRWLTHGPSSPRWIMWDLALVIALARPDLAEKVSFTTPPENTQRQVQVYTSVDVDAMRQDWWNTVDRAHAKAKP